VNEEADADAVEQTEEEENQLLIKVVDRISIEDHVDR
jgi:hypothetical protein